MRRENNGFWLRSVISGVPGFAADVSQHLWRYWRSLCNRPFYSCVPSNLAFEWKRGWRWPCFDTNPPAFLMLTSLHLHMKSRRVCIKTRSPPASLPLKGQVTRHTTVKWPIRALQGCKFFTSTCPSTGWWWLSSKGTPHCFHKGRAQQEATFGQWRKIAVIASTHRTVNWISKDLFFYFQCNLTP